MSCSCGTANRESAKFCTECGSPLTRACTACDADLAPGAKFCDECGAAAGDTAHAAPERAAIASTGVRADGGPVRKTVTVVFCDLVGSTAFGESVDPEAARDAMGRYYEMVQDAVEAHGGTLAKFIGDGAMAIFGIPEVAEDDADRAVAAGLDLQRRFGVIKDHIATRHGIDVALRVGVNTGEVVIADDDADIVGDALNTAARLEAACAPGRVLVGEDTWRLTRSTIGYEVLDAVAVKGKAEPVATFQVVDEAMVVDEASPFVGRVQELAELVGVVESARTERAAKMATVIGSPGVGKTRLALELARSVGDGVRWFDLRCERSGTATFAPVAELLRSVAGIGGAADSQAALAAVESLFDEAMTDRDLVIATLAGVVGAAAPRSTEESFFGVRRLLEFLARDQTVLLVVDDIQWAEPLFLDLLEHLVEWVRDAPVVIVALARPEIREIRPAVTEAGRRLAAVVSLDGLAPAETELLAAKLLGADRLPAELTERLPASTQGNPLFVRELVRMLVDDGVIDHSGSEWVMTIDADAVEVPPTIQSLLAARVERMPAAERRVVELASVMGSEFPRGSLAGLDAAVAASLPTVFETLRRKEIIEPTGTYWGDEPIYRFHHVLMRDAAYRRILKAARADLHTAAAEWTERTAADLVGEYEVGVAFHFEQAHHYRIELGLDDHETRAAGNRAASLFEIAAERALERDDVASAGTSARRALACLLDGDARRRGLLVLGCEALLGAGDVAGARVMLDELDAIGDDPRLDAWGACFNAQLITLSRPDQLSFAEASVGSAAERLAELGDQAGVAKARQVRARTLAALGRVGDCEAELDLALTAARAADDRRRVRAVLGSAPTAALWGPSTVARAGGRCLDVLRLLRITSGSPAVEATSVRCQAVLEALRGRFDAARSMLETSRATATELGLRQGLLETEYYAGLVELYAGRPAAAEPYLRTAHGGLGKLGIGADAGQAAAHLARALLLLDRVDEADELAAQADALAGQNTQTLIAARSVQAEILAAKGALTDAVALAEEAVALASGRDIVVDHAQAVLALSRVRAAAGDAAGAQRARDDALALFELKGATGVMGSVESSLDTAGSQRPSPDEAGQDHRSAGPAEHAAMATGGDPAAAGRLGTSLPRTRATENTRALGVAMASGDRSAMRALMSPDHVFVARMKGLGVPPASGGEAFIDALMDVSAAARAVDVEILAVRGDDLCLARVSVDQEAWEWQGTLSVHQVDADGREIRNVTFDGDDLAEAALELDRLYADALPGEISEIVRVHAQSEAAVSTNDADMVGARFRAVVAEDFVGIDHRSIGWGHQDRASFIERQVSRCALGLAISYPQMHRVTADGLLYRVDAQRGGGATIWSQLSITMYRDGQQTRMESFPADQLDAALARFDELTSMATRSATGSTLPRTRATENTRALGVAIASGDRSAMRALMSPDHVFVARMKGLGVPPVSGGEAFIDALMDVSGAARAVDVEILAVRGNDLCLARVSVDQEPWEWYATLSVHQVDADGREIRHVTFDGDDLAEAALELDRLYFATLPDAVGPIGRAHIAVAEAEYANDSDLFRARLDEHLSPDFVSIDHRNIGWGEQDKTAFVERQTSRTRSLGADFTHLYTQMHRVTADGLVLTVSAQTDGATATWSVICLAMYRDGKLAREESFADDQLDAALARFDELTSMATRSATGSALPRTRATENLRAMGRASASGDRLAMRTLVSPDHVFVVRNKGPAIPPSIGGEAFIDTLVDRNAAARAVDIDILAVRGDDLCLARVSLDQEAWDYEPTLSLTQLDPDGLEVRHVTFDEDDLAAAGAELDHLYLDSLSGGVRESLQMLWETQRVHDTNDPEAVEALYRAWLSPDFVGIDHRGLGWGLQDTELFIERQVSRTRLGPDFIIWYPRIHRLTVDGVLYEAAARSGEGSATWWLLVLVRYRDGELTRSESFAIDQLDAALARFDAFEAGHDDGAATVATAPDRPVSGRLENRSTRWLDRWQELWRARDWAGFEALMSPDIEFIERRSGPRSDTTAPTRAQLAGSMARFVDVGFTEVARETLAIRGDHLSLNTARWTTPDGLTSERLTIDEVGRDDTISRLWNYDIDAVGEALVELDQRYLASLPQALADTFRPFVALNAAVNARDVEAIAATLAAELIAVDHRRIGWPDLDREGFVQRFTTGFSTSRTVWCRDVPGLAPGVALVETDQMSTAADDHLIDWWVLVSSGGRIDRAENFGDDAQAAQARFDELARATSDTAAPAPGVPPSELETSAFDGPATSPPLENRSTQLIDRWLETWRARDWEGFEALLSPDIEFIERRSGPISDASGITRAELVELTKGFVDVGFTEITRETLAVRGDDLSINTARWTTAEGLEHERLTIDEVGPDGTVVRVVSFDIDAIGEAAAELDRRYLEILPEGHRQAFAPLAAGSAGINRRDLDAVLREFAGDFVEIDHRPLSWGELDFADNSRRVASAIEAGLTHWWSHIWAITENAIIVRAETAFPAASGRRSAWLVNLLDNGLIVRSESFPEDQFDAALARFHELDDSHPAPRAHPGRPPLENRATTAYRRENLLATALTVHAIRGDRLAVVEQTVDAAEGARTFLVTIEIDADGRIAAETTSDVEDLAAVMADLDRRWLEHEGPAHAAGAAPLLAFDRAASTGDLAAVRSLIADDFVAVDRSRLGWPEQDADRFVASRVRPPDEADRKTVYTAAFWRHTPTLALRSVHSTGTWSDGCTFFNENLVLSESRNELMIRAEFFEPNAFAEAVARFDALADAEAHQTGHDPRHGANDAPLNSGP